MVTAIAIGGPAAPTPALAPAAKAEHDHAHAFPASSAPTASHRAHDHEPWTPVLQREEPQLSSSQGSKSSVATSASSHFANQTSASDVAKPWTAVGFHPEDRTAPVTADTSPGSVQDTSRSEQVERLKALAAAQRPITPTVLADALAGRTSASTSPMVLDTPYLNPSAKRTANGHVKSMSNDTTGRQVTGNGFGRPTHRGVERSAGISELSSQLKTRLSYAMLKVQHGWEKQSLDQLESLTPVHSLPSTPASHTGHHSHHNRRFSHFSDASEGYIASPAYQISPDRKPRLLYENVSVPQHRSWATGPGNGNAMHHSPPSKGLIPTLAPAAPISSSRSKRRNTTTSARSPPYLAHAGCHQHHPSNSSHPHHPHHHHSGGYASAFTSPAAASPASARAGILRMPSRQAEKDVVDALIFMSSPNNSANMKREDGGFNAGRRVGFMEGPRYRYERDSS